MLYKITNQEQTMIYIQFYMTLSIKTQFCSTLPIKNKDVLKGIIRFHYLTICPCSMTKTAATGL